MSNVQSSSWKKRGNFHRKTVIETFILWQWHGLPSLIRKWLDVINTVYVIRRSKIPFILLMNHPAYFMFLPLVLALAAVRVTLSSTTVYCTANITVFCWSKVFAAEMTWNKFWLWEVNHCSSGGLQLFSLTSPLLADRGWFPSLRDSGV